MKKEIVTAVITGLIGLIGGYAIHNEQNLTVQINGQNVDISNVQEKVTALENENSELKSQIEDMQNGKDANAFTKPVSANSTDYLVYKLEPYGQKGYKKVTDESMSIAGVNYNNGFELATSYSEGYCIFNLEGKYATLSGKIGCGDSNRTDKIPVEFWGDGALLDTIVLYKNDLAQDFSLNVSGISKFEISIPHEAYSVVDFADIKVR